MSSVDPIYVEARRVLRDALVALTPGPALEAALGLEAALVDESQHVRS